MIISIVTAAHNASPTIGAMLSSIYAPPLPQGWTLDVIVIDDGSRDSEALKGIVAKYPDARLFQYTVNLGKLAAVNYAVPKTHGSIVVILDADDTLVPEWPSQLKTILHDWPSDTPICFSACKTNDGGTTVSDPMYTGYLSFDDMLNDRHMGEYLPLFRGSAIRKAGGYKNPGRGVGCELWTYLTYAEQTDLWISSEVMRVYNNQSADSLSSSLFTPEGAAKLTRCYDLIFKDFEDAYKKNAPQTLGLRKMRQAVFSAISGQRNRAWALWKSGAQFQAPLETLGAMVLIGLGPKAIKQLVVLAKRLGLLRRYG